MARRASLDYGRYFLSLGPRPEFGFQKAGEVRGGSLSFTMGANTFIFECKGRIASGHAPYNLYVLYDAGWHLKGNARNANLIAAEDSNSVEELIHR